MRIATNPGTNIPAELVAKYRIALAPQQLVFRDARYDTRVEELALAEIDRLVAKDKVGPVRAWFANVLSLRPLLAFEDGALAMLGTLNETTTRWR